MSQQDGPIDVNAFNLDVEAMAGQTIGIASTLSLVKNLQYTTNQTAVSGLSFLLPTHFFVLSLENTRLKYHPAFGYYSLNLSSVSTQQFFLNQTFNVSVLTSNLFLLANLEYALSLMVLSSLFPTLINAPAFISAHISIQTISPSVFAGPPTTCGRRGRKKGRKKRNSHGSCRADKGERNATLQDLALTPGINEDVYIKKLDEK